MQLDSKLSVDVLQESMVVAIEGCRKIKQEMDHAMKNLMLRRKTISSFNSS